MNNKDENILILEKIGNNIRKERIAKNMSLKELSQSINMSYATVQKYEIGKIEPSIIMLIDIARVLNINVSRLLKIDIEIDISESELKSDINYIKNILEQILINNNNLNITKYKEFVNKTSAEKLNYFFTPVNCEITFIDNKIKLKTKNGIFDIKESDIEFIYEEIKNFIEFKLLKYENK